MATMAMRPSSLSLSTTKPPHTTPHPEPVPYLSHVGKGGQDALWIGFVVFVLSTLIISTLAARLSVKHRALHLITLIITGVAALSYYSMATHSGVSYVAMGWRNIGGEKTLVIRQVFWARYVDWAITSPLILLDLALLAGLPWIDTLLLLLADEAAVFSTTFAALIHGREAAKWGWYAFSCIFLILVFSSLLTKGRTCARHQHAPVMRLYTVLALYTVLVWIIYPIIFALSEGTGTINVNGEVIAYTVLDIFAKAVFGLWLIVAHKHDSEELHGARFAEIWLETRGRGGAIQLPGGDD